MRKNVLKIAYFAIFVAIGCLFNILSSNTPLFMVSLVSFVALITGVLIGPYYGFCAMALSDFIIAFLVPQGPWSPILTLSNGLIAFFSGSIVNYIIPGLTEDRSIKGNILYNLMIILSGIAAFAVCSQLLTNMALVLPPLNYYGGLYYAAFLKRIAGQSVVWSINVALSAVFLTFAKATFLKNNVFGESLNIFKGETTVLKRTVALSIAGFIILAVVITFIILKFAAGVI